MDFFDITITPELVQTLQDPEVSQTLAMHALKRLTFIASLREYKFKAFTFSHFRFFNSGGGRKKLAAMPEVTKTLAKYLPSDNLPNCEPTVIPPQLFLATVKLLAKLSSSFTPALSIQTTTKSTQLREWASDTIVRPAVIQKLVDILNTSETGPDALGGELRESCAYAITALSTLGPLFIVSHQSQ